MATCYNCGSPITAEPPISRSLECASCNQQVRCCRNCIFYLPGAHWDCRETIPEPVHDKTRANFCDYFKLNANSPGNGSAGSGGDTASTAARRTFDGLFS
jgi:hypothetical protein